MLRKPLKETGVGVLILVRWVPNAELFVVGYLSDFLNTPNLTREKLSGKNC